MVPVTKCPWVDGFKVGMLRPAGRGLSRLFAITPALSAHPQATTYWPCIDGEWHDVKKQGLIHGYRSRVRVGRDHFEVTIPCGQEQWDQRNKTIKKVKCDWPTDRPTDWPTNQWTNRPTYQPTDKAGCRVACTRLKICLWDQIYGTK